MNFLGGAEGQVANHGYVGGNPMSYIDPYGLAPGDRYGTADKAGIQAIRDINARSISEGLEYAGRIYRNRDGSYSYTTPIRGQKKSADFGQCPPGKTNAGQYHTHGSANPDFWDEKYSNSDMDWADKENVPSYLGTPSGNIGKYTPNLSTGPRSGRALSVERVGK